MLRSGVDQSGKTPTHSRRLIEHHIETLFTVFIEAVPVLLVTRLGNIRYRLMNMTGQHDARVHSRMLIVLRQ